MGKTILYKSGVTVTTKVTASCPPSSSAALTVTV
jgi:hypothetical protein